jgi:tetratricopeptide (TPR) repeat protein
MKTLFNTLALLAVAATVAITGCAQNPHLSGGRLYRSQKVYDKAQRELELAVQQEPNNPLAHLELGMVYAEVGETKKAGVEFEKALALNPKMRKDVDANRKHYWVQHFNAGIKLTNEDKNFEEAAKEFQKAIDLDTADPRAYTNLAFCLRKMDKPDEALQLFEKAATLNPTDPTARKNLAASYVDMGRDAIASGAFADGIKLFEKALELDSTLVQTEFDLGNAYSQAAQADTTPAGKKAKYEQAMIMYNRVLTRTPDHVDAIFNLGTAYLAMERIEEALPFLKKAVDLDPKAYDFHNRLGRAYARSGEEELAVAEIVVSKALQKGMRQSDLESWLDSASMASRYPDTSTLNATLQSVGQPEDIYMYQESGGTVEVWFYWTKGVGFYFVNGGAPRINKVIFAPQLSQ